MYLYHLRREKEEGIYVRMGGERVRLHTDKEKRVHSQKQSVNFTTVTPTPLASPFNFML